jgi:hypothetical protein
MITKDSPLIRSGSFTRSKGFVATLEPDNSKELREAVPGVVAAAARPDHGIRPASPCRVIASDVNDRARQRARRGIGRSGQWATTDP